MVVPAAVAAIAAGGGVDGQGGDSSRGEAAMCGEGLVAGIGVRAVDAASMSVASECSSANGGWMGHRRRVVRKHVSEKVLRQTWDRGTGLFDGWSYVLSVGVVVMQGCRW